MLSVIVFAEVVLAADELLWDIEEVMDVVPESAIF